MKRKVLTKDGSGVFSVQQQDVPELQEYEVLVEVKSSGISQGTHLAGIKNLRAQPVPSIGCKPFGYQNSGIILETGPKVSCLQKGLRVACMGGGALHTNLAVVPQNLCVPIPEDISFEEAAFTNLAGTAMQAVRRSTIEFGENVLVVGLGIVGNLAGQLASLCGAHAAGADFIGKRRELADNTGFELTLNPAGNDRWIEECTNFASPYGIDCAFICFGGDATALFKDIKKIMKISPDGHVMGRIVIPGGCEVKTKFGAATGNLDIRSSARTGPGYHDPYYEQGCDYPKVFVPWTTKRNIEEFYRAVSKGVVNFKPLITHTFSLEEGPEACNLLVESPDEALGVVLKP